MWLLSCVLEFLVPFPFICPFPSFPFLFIIPIFQSLISQNTHFIPFSQFSNFFSLKKFSKWPNSANSQSSNPPSNAGLQFPNSAPEHPLPPPSPPLSPSTPPPLLPTSTLSSSECLAAAISSHPTSFTTRCFKSLSTSRLLIPTTKVLSSRVRLFCLSICCGCWKTPPLNWAPPMNSLNSTLRICGIYI